MTWDMLFERMMDGGAGMPMPEQMPGEMARVSPVPLPMPMPLPMTRPAPVMYTVRRGDTLFGIARQFGVTIDAIIAANGLTDLGLSVGQQLVIPTAAVRPVPPIAPIPPIMPIPPIAPIPPMPPVRPIPPIGQIRPMIPRRFIYIVRPGDTLFMIARRFGIPLAVLRAHNRLSSDMLRIGQRLEIPQAMRTEG